MNYFFLTLLLALSFHPVAQAQTSLSKQQLTEIQHNIDRIRNDHNISAALLMIVNKKDILMQHHSGTIDWDKKTPFAEHHQFRIGSISKTFAGLLALRLEQENKINLHASFESYVSQSPINYAQQNKSITLAHLLEHTAGFADMQKPEWDYNAAEPIDLAQAFALKKGTPTVKWPVGLHASYSNIGAGLFGMALEQHLGISYEQLIDQQVFKPMGMHSTQMLFNKDVQKHLITGYNNDGKTPIPYWHIIYRPAAAINTNAKDMAVFLKMILNHGQIGNQQILSPANASRWAKPTTTLAAQSGLDYGYGLGMYQWQRQGHSFFGHGGDADGYLTHFGVNHDTGLAYLVMINAFQKRPLLLMRTQVERLITDTLEPAQAPSGINLPEQQLNTYAGKYTEVTHRFNQPPSGKANELLITVEQGQLKMQSKQYRNANLLAMNKSHFRLASQTVATMAFIEHGDDLYFQGQWGNFIKIKDDKKPAK